MKRRFVLAILAVVLAFVFVRPAVAQQSATTWKESGIELRVYDVKALFDRIPIYNFARVPGTDEAAMRHGYGDGRAGALFEESDPDYRGETSRRASELRSLIEELVRPKEPWDTVGGRSSIRFVTSRGLMFVSTTPDGHEQIDGILKRIIPAGKKTVSVEVKVVEIDPAAFGGKSPAGFVASTDDQKALLAKAIRKVRCTAALTGADGQVLSNERGRARAYVSDSEPVVAERAVGADLVIGTVNDGLALEIQATLASNAPRATFDFRLSLTRSVGEGQTKVTAAVPNQSCESTIQLPTLISDAQAGTVDLPLDSPMIVAGGTVPAALFADKGEEADADTLDVYYIATVRLVDGAAAPAQADEKR